MNNAKKLISAMLLLSVLVPSVAFAHNNNESDKNNKKEEKHQVVEQKKVEKHEKKEEKKSQDCLATSNRWGWGWWGHRNNTKECRDLRLSLWKQFIAQYIHDHPSTTTPPVVDVTAPVLSSVTVSGITNVAAAINWTTNENATGKVYYSTTSPVATATAQSVGVATLTTAHGFSLTSLSANTAYYFVVESKDANGNTVLSGQQTFTTLINPDVTAPTLSAVLVSGIASTSATISWTSNENAAGKVYYGTSTPVVIATAPSVGTSSLSTAHTFTLTGLSTSTQYFFVLESKDASNNTGTSSESNFTTTAS